MHVHKVVIKASDCKRGQSEGMMAVAGESYAVLCRALGFSSGALAALGLTLKF